MAGDEAFFMTSLVLVFGPVWAPISLTRWSWLQSVFVWAAALPHASELGTGETCGIECSGDWLFWVYWLNWFCALAPWNKYGPGRGTGESNCGGGMVNRWKREALLKSSAIFSNFDKPRGNLRYDTSTW